MQRIWQYPMSPVLADPRSALAAALRLGRRMHRRRSRAERWSRRHEQDVV
jgi:hypothetical protein